MKQDNTWHSGPPPSLGWWPASCGKAHDVYRWWDGENWSCYAEERSTKKEIENAERCKLSGNQSDIEWQHRPANWPARSRT